jgi:hypothetical protein
MPYMPGSRGLLMCLALVVVFLTRPATIVTLVATVVVWCVGGGFTLGLLVAVCGLLISFALLKLSY